MKPVLPFILIAATFVSAFAQQFYKTILPNSETYFINQSGIIKAVAIESVYVSGADTIYENFKSIRPDSVNCSGGLTVNGPSWIGEKVVIQPDGKNLFFNRYHDTITIETMADLNDSWGLFHFSNGNWMEAMVTSVGTEDIFGDTDSVKVIGLQLKDSLGNPLQHVLNSKSFLISKAHGLITTFDLYKFPNDTTEYHITNKKRLTVGEVYDFEVGDERQIKAQFFAYYYRIETSYNLDVIINKSYSSALDSIFYQIQRKSIRYTTTRDSVGNFSEPVISVSEDTFYESYTQLNEPILALMPGESLSQGYDLWDYSLHSINSAYNGRRYLVYGNYNHYLNETDSCWNPIIDGSFSQTTYIEGLGEIIYDDYTIGGYYEEELIYYKKGQEIYGELFTATDEISQLNYSISIYPNPLTQNATLEYTLQQAETLSIRLLDMQGKIIRTFIENATREAGSHQQALTLPDGLPSGSYLLTIESAKGKMGMKVVNQ